MRYFPCMLSLLLGLSSSRVNGNYLVNYEESEETYVDYPTDGVSQELLDSQPLIPKVHLALWTTVDDFRHPLFYLVKGIVRRLDKDLLVFEPSYYLQDGRNEGCRVMNELTQLEEPNPEMDCSQNCTNYGRYCAGEVPQEGDLAERITGAEIVTESLRQLCVWVVYGKTGGSNMLHFFRYVNDLLFEQCHHPFSKNCTYSVMDRIEVSPHFIERCMNHTHGLDADDMNPYLREQVDKSRDITSAMVPRLKIGNYWYTGEETTGEIFRAVCANYPADKQPLACDFCKDCSDVRYCLWHLQCNNGQTFELFAEARLNGHPESTSSPNLVLPAPTTAEPALTPVPTESPVAAIPLATAPPTAVPVTDNLRSSASSTTNNEEDRNTQNKKAAQDALMSGILVGLSLGVVVSGVYACKDFQARIMLNEIRKDDQAMQAQKDTELAKTETASPTSAAGMLRRLQDIEAMIDGGKDVGDLLDVVSERTGKAVKTRVHA